MKVGILGCGWVGKHLLKNLSGQYDVRYSNRVKGIDDERSFQVDLSEESKIDKEFFAVDVIVVLMTSKVLEDYIRLIECISPTCKVIFSSSTSVYAYSSKVIDENAVLKKESKLVEIERLLQSSLNDRLTILRLAGLYGENRLPSGFIRTNIVKRSNQVVNMVCGEDVVQAIRLIFEKELFGEIFNICSNHHPTRKEFYSFWKKEPLIFESCSETPKCISSDYFIQQSGMKFKSVIEI